MKIENTKKYLSDVILIGLTCIFLFGLPLINISYSQDINPVAWRFSARKTENKTFEIRIRATINRPWHIYSQQTPEGAAMPTSITFDKNPLITMEGKCEELGKLEVKIEDDVLLKYYSGQVEFVQVIKIKASVKTTLTGTVNFMACTAERCLPPSDKDFTISIDARN